MAKLTYVPDPAPPHKIPAWGMGGFPPSETQFRTWRIDFGFCVGLQLNDVAGGAPP